MSQEYLILETLAKTPNSMRLADLSAASDIPISTLCKLLPRMEQQGLIFTDGFDNDGKSNVIVFIKPLGRSQLK
jgi:DNA-binding IclR family transcriptional regulator